MHLNRTISCTWFSSAFTSARFPHPLSLWLVYGLFLVAGVAQAAIVPLLPRMSAHFALSASQTALLLALPGLATLAVSVPSGIAADRIGARRVTLRRGRAAVPGLCRPRRCRRWPRARRADRVRRRLRRGVDERHGLAGRSRTRPGAGRGLGPAVTCSSVGIMLGPGGRRRAGPAHRPRCALRGDRRRHRADRYSARRGDARRCGAPRRPRPWSAADLPARDRLRPAAGQRRPWAGRSVSPRVPAGAGPAPAGGRGGRRAGGLGRGEQRQPAAGQRRTAPPRTLAPVGSGWPSRSRRSATSPSARWSSGSAPGRARSSSTR